MAIRNVYSVGQVNKYIGNMFASDFMLRVIAVKGEVSNCKYHTSGHIYFTLKDASGTLSAVMFAGYRRNGLSFRMKEGDKVVVTGSVEVYEKSGSYQLYAREIQLDGTGNLYQKFEELKRELEEMGMFAQEYKRPIPRFAKRIGVVTAPTGAAIQDIRNISSRRNPYVQLILYPALVQGQGAAESIVKGIHALEALGVDVMIVGRGGGSIEDLWAFNEEIVARAIFDCTVPVISAVGHETDWTIADFVSDLRAPTPSAAAELAVYDHASVVLELANRKRRMDLLLQTAVGYARERLAHQQTKLSYLSPQTRLNENRRLAAEQQNTLEYLMQKVLNDRRHQLALLAAWLDSNSPAKKLSGGCAYVEDGEHRPVKSASQLKERDRIQIYFADGIVRGEVNEIIGDAYDPGRTF